LGRRLSICLGKYAAVFQAEALTILACVYEIQMNDRQEKYINIYSDNQATLRALQTAKAISPLVQQCQKTLNNISFHHSVGLIWVLRYSGICRNEIANGLTREKTVHQFV
jgi:hypothetical protein